MTLKPSLRMQWTLALLVAALVVAGIVIFVDNNNQPESTPAPPISKAAVVEENREANILVRQDQAPHLDTLGAGVRPAAGAEAAVRAYIARQIALGDIVGPIERAGCAGAPGGTAGRLVLRCTVEAANVNYPFDVVVTTAKRQLTYCKRDYPPVPSMNIPVSARCT